MLCRTITAPPLASSKKDVAVRAWAQVGVRLFSVVILSIIGMSQVQSGLLECVITSRAERIFKQLLEEKRTAPRKELRMYWWSLQERSPPASVS